MVFYHLFIVLTNKFTAFDLLQLLLLKIAIAIFF